MTMSEEQRNAPNPLLEDERKNPVYRLGRAVAGFMVIVWAGVLILVFYLVYIITKKQISHSLYIPFFTTVCTLQKGRLKNQISIFQTTFSNS